MYLINKKFFQFCIALSGLRPHPSSFPCRGLRRLPMVYRPFGTGGSAIGTGEAFYFVCPIETTNWNFIIHPSRHEPTQALKGRHIIGTGVNPCDILQAWV